MRARSIISVLSVSVLFVGLVTAANAEGGNIYPNAIEVDANLYPAGSIDCDSLGSATGFDWVADCADNTDLDPGVDAAPNGVGHWNGYRVTDGVAGGDQDIFLNGGKENDVATWNPGPGSVGSSKYDITQAYIANNSTDAFFGMERRGNNGTTAFDFEFDKLPPSLANPDYIPMRSECDVLVTFEMQGSGHNGSATPYLYRYDDPDVPGAPADCDSSATYPADSDQEGAFVSVGAAGIATAINENSIEGAPWGFVDSRGYWTTGQLDRFEFAEARVPLELLGISGADVCSDVSRYLQVRTRSSSTDTSDLKDTTKIRSFSFFQPTSPSVLLSESCGATFHFGSSSIADATWKFSYSNDAAHPTTLSSSDVTLSGPSDNGGTRSYTTVASSGNVKVSLDSGGPDSVTISVERTGSADYGCATQSTGSIVVHRELGVTASLSPQCGNTFGYSATSTGGTGARAYSWKFQHKVGGSWVDVSGALGASTSQSGTVTMPTSGEYRGIVTVTDSAVAATGKPSCEATFTTTSVSVYDDVAAGASATADCDATFTWSASAGGGKAPYDITVKVQKYVDGAWVDQGTPTDFADDADGEVSGFYDASGSPGTYRIRVLASDDQATPCSASASSGPIEVRDPLTASAVKDAATTQRNTLTAGLNGGHAHDLAGDTVTYQWQISVDGGATWSDLAGKTTEDSTYDGFKVDATPGDVTFVVDGDTYVGRRWAVDLRLVVTRTAGGVVCTATSSPVTVKIIEGVDP